MFFEVTTIILSVFIILCLLKIKQLIHERNKLIENIYKTMRENKELHREVLLYAQERINEKITKGI